MKIKYHFLEPGEDVAVIRLSRAAKKEEIVNIVITMRECDFRDLIKEFTPRLCALDYDGTLTRIGTVYSSGEDRSYHTGWQEVRARLPVAGQAALNRHYQLYKEEKITPLEWLYITVACYQKYGLTKKDFLETAGRVPFRRGYKGLFSCLSRHFQSKTIISFGLEDWINCRPELSGFDHCTIASKLIYDKQDVVAGVVAGVTEETKGLAIKQILQNHGWNKTNALSIGNSWHDRHLFAQAGISLYLSHGGYKGSGVDYAVEVERLKSVATAIIFSDTLIGVNDLLSKVLNKNLDF